MVEGGRGGERVKINQSIHYRIGRVLVMPLPCPCPYPTAVGRPCTLPSLPSPASRSVMPYLNTHGGGRSGARDAKNKC